MRLYIFLVVSAFGYKQYSGSNIPPQRVSSKCNSLTNSDWWTAGHVEDSCTNENNLRSECSISCRAPFVSDRLAKPYDNWTVKCQKPAEPTWVSTRWGQKSNDCYFCPTWTYQGKNTKIVGRWSDADTGLVTGIEMRLLFLKSNFENPTCASGGFAFALEFREGLPMDAVIIAPGADATFISPKRTVVTFKPLDMLNNLQHLFWRGVSGEGGGRVTIFANDLSGVKLFYGARLYLVCQDVKFGQEVKDLSCHETPSAVGTSLKPPLPTMTTTTVRPTTDGATTTEFTTTTMDTTTTSTASTTTSGPTTTTERTTTTGWSTTTTAWSTEPTTTTDWTTFSTASTTFNTTTGPSFTDTATTSTTETVTATSTTSATTTATTTGVTTTLGPSCFERGSHHLGSSLLEFPDGDKWMYEGFIDIPISGWLPTFGAWTITVTYDKPVYLIVFLKGTVEKIDTKGKVWKFIGAASQFYEDVISISYDGQVDTQGGNTATKIVYCMPEECAPDCENERKSGK